MPENVIIYFRSSIEMLPELEAAGRHFPCVESRMLIPSGSLVISRYSCLPFYEELERDVDLLRGRLLNSYQQHRFVADIRTYYPHIQDLTPRTWEQWGNLPTGLSYVVKGITNSRKHEWSRRMFAASKSEIPRIVGTLLDDDLIRDQGIIVREYVPLKRLGEGINGLPISNEWRFFCLNGEILINGYYWASEPETQPYLRPPQEAEDLVREVCRRVKDYIPFFVVDVAEKAAGDWIVIELNDGQMSGLSMIDPDQFYQELAKKLHGKLCDQPQQS